MTVTEALEKLKSYEQTSFALSHAMGLLYYDGVTAGPRAQPPSAATPPASSAASTIS